MSDDTTPIVQDPPPQAQSVAESSGDAILKGIIAILLVIAVAMGGWALSMRAELQEKDDQIAELTVATASLEAESSAAGSAVADDLARADEDISAAVGALGLTVAELDVKENQVRAATSALETATDKADKAQGRLEEAEADRDLYLAQRDVALLCAQGSLSALSLVYSTDDIDDSVQTGLDELNKAATACQEAGRTL